MCVCVCVCVCRFRERVKLLVGTPNRISFIINHDPAQKRQISFIHHNPPQKRQFRVDAQGLQLGEFAQDLDPACQLVSRYVPA